MSDSSSSITSRPAGGESVKAVSEEALKKAEAFIEADEGASNKFKGWLAVLVTVMAVAMSVFHLYTAYAIFPTQWLRPIHVGMVLTRNDDGDLRVAHASGRVRIDKLDQQGIFNAEDGKYTHHLRTIRRIL